MGNKVCCAPKENQDLRDLSDNKPMKRKANNISDKKPRILSCDYGIESPTHLSPVSTKIEKLYDSPKEVSLRLTGKEIMVENVE